MKRATRTLLSLLAALAMVFTAVPVLAAEGESSAALGLSGTITGFETAEVQVAPGTPEEDLGLPGAVTANVRPAGEDTASATVQVGVGQWVTPPGMDPYDPAAEASAVYTFAADLQSLALPAGVTLPAGVDMPLVRVTVSDAAAPSRSVNTVQRTETLKIDDNTADEINTQEGWKWEKNTSTLTLNGFDFSSSANFENGIDVDIKATIVLEGTDNKISTTATGSNGIWVSDDLTIKGTGSLEITAVNTGIYVNNGKLIFDGVTVNSDGGTGSSAASGIFVASSSDSVEINHGANVTLTGVRGFYGDDTPLGISGSSLTATGKERNGISCDSLTLSGGTLKVASGTMDDMLALRAYGNVTIDSGIFILDSKTGNASNKAPTPTVDYRYRLSPNGSYTSSQTLPYAWYYSDKYIEIETGVFNATPSAPQNFTATPGDGQVTLTWDTPAGTGGSPITKYEVSKDDGTTWEDASSSTGHTFTGLTNGQEYTFQVRAHNSLGSGGSASETATPSQGGGSTVPGAPQNLTATPGDGLVTLNWQAPASGGVIAKYEVSKDDGAAWEDASSNAGHTFTGLTNGQEYTFQARAVNSVGAGATASVTATPRQGGGSVTVPDAPRNLTATPGNHKVTLDWEAPGGNGGSAITKYEVSMDDGASWADTDTDSSHTVTGLTNGQRYTFQVRAQNSVGAGAAASITSKPTNEIVYRLTVVNGTGSSSYEAGEQVTITANPAPAGQRFYRWVGGGTTYYNAYSSTTIFPMPKGDAVVTATYMDTSSGNGGGGSGGGGSGGGGGGGGSGGGGGGGGGGTGSDSGSDAASSASGWLEPDLTQTQAGAAGEEAIVGTKSSAPCGIRKSFWSKLKGLQFRHDTMDGGDVQVRLTISSPEQLARDIYVTGYVKGSAVEKRKAFFEKWYQNKVQVIQMDEKEPWGQAVEIAAKLDLTAMDTKKLCIYSYDAKTNTYIPITTTNDQGQIYWIDDKGYLHIYTEYAGSIVVSEGPLQMK